MNRKRKQIIFVGHTPSLENSWQPFCDIVAKDAERLKEALIARENWRWSLQWNKSEVKVFGDPKHYKVYGIDANNLVRVIIYIFFSHTHP